MDLIHYVVKDGVLDSAAQLGDTISPMDQQCASEVGCSMRMFFIIHHKLCTVQTTVPDTHTYLFI
jgi:hypothetical protein